MNAPNSDNFTEAHYREALHQVRLALEETNALYSVARALISSKNLPDLLRTVVDSVAQALPADRVVLITFDLEAHQVTHFIKGGPGINDVVDVSFEELRD